MTMRQVLSPGNVRGWVLVVFCKAERLLMLPVPTTVTKD